MGGHLKELCGLRSGGRKSRRVVDIQFLNHSLLDTPHQLLCRHVWPRWTPHTCFHPCLFLSCSRTHSLSQVVGAVAVAAASLNPVQSSPSEDSSCCQVYALQLPVCYGHVFIPGPTVGTVRGAAHGQESQSQVGDTPVSHYRQPC